MKNNDGHKVIKNNSRNCASLFQTLCSNYRHSGSDKC